MIKISEVSPQALLTDYCESGLASLGFEGERLSAAMRTLKRHLDHLSKTGQSLDLDDFFNFDAKVDVAAQSFDVEREQILAAVGKRPSLLFRSVATMADNAEKTAQGLGVPRKDYIEAAMRYPQLVFQSPDTIIGHARLMKVFNIDKMIDPPVETFYLKNPMKLCRSDADTRLRLVFARESGREHEGNFGLLSMKSYRVEKELLEFMGYTSAQATIQPPKKGSGFAVYQDGVLEEIIEEYQLRP